LRGGLHFRVDNHFTKTGGQAMKQADEAQQARAERQAQAGRLADAQGRLEQARQAVARAEAEEARLDAVIEACILEGRG
jgi:predicted Zn-dependent protease